MYMVSLNFFYDTRFSKELLYHHEGCNTNFTGCTTSSADIALPPAKLHNNPSIAKFHNFI